MLLRYRQEGGPTISEGVQIFLKYEVQGSKYFEIFGPGEPKVGESKFYMTGLLNHMFSKNSTCSNLPGRCPWKSDTRVSWTSFRDWITPSCVTSFGCRRKHHLSQGCPIVAMTPKVAPAYAFWRQGWLLLASIILNRLLRARGAAYSATHILCIVIRTHV